MKNSEKTYTKWTALLEDVKNTFTSHEWEVEDVNYTVVNYGLNMKKKDVTLFHHELMAIMEITKKYDVLVWIEYGTTDKKLYERSYRMKVRFH